MLGIVKMMTSVIEAMNFDEFGSIDGPSEPGSLMFQPLIPLTS